MIKRIHGVLLGAFILGGLTTTALAQDLVYEPINPSFGGNPFNSSHLLAIANAQNDYERPRSATSTSDDLDRFIRSLQSRLLSALSSQVAEAIFGENAQNSGRIVFGDQVIEFVRTLDGIVLTITEADGSQTVITIPTLITEPLDTDSSGQSGANSRLASQPLGSLTPGAPLSGQLIIDSPLSEPGPLTEPIVQPIN